MVGGHVHGQTGVRVEVPAGNYFIVKGSFSNEPGAATKTSGSISLDTGHIDFVPKDTPVTVDRGGLTVKVGDQTFVYFESALAPSCIDKQVHQPLIDSFGARMEMTLDQALKNLGSALALEKLWTSESSGGNTNHDGDMLDALFVGEVEFSLAGYDFGSPDNPGQTVAAGPGDSGYCLVYAKEIAGQRVMIPVLGGFTVNGVFYSPVIFGDVKENILMQFSSPADVSAYAAKEQSRQQTGPRPTRLHIIRWYDSAGSWHTDPASLFDVRPGYRDAIAVLLDGDSRSQNYLTRLTADQPPEKGFGIARLAAELRPGDLGLVAEIIGIDDR